MLPVRGGLNFDFFFSYNSQRDEDRLRASMRRENKQRRVKEKASNRGLSAGYLEPDNYEEEEDGGVSLAAIKNKFKKSRNGKYSI